MTVVEAALIAATGGVRSTTTPSQLAVERLALSAVAVWFGPFGLSGIEASAAITQAHTSPSAMLPKSAVQLNVVDLPALPGTEHDAL